ncbi:MAG: hypothetical protein WBO18_09730 [Gammaproteobacteria bacterium]
MKLIRWLLSNIILIAFVLALTYAYVYWDNLTGEDTPAGKLIAYLSTEYEEVAEFLQEYGLTGEESAEVVEAEMAQDIVDTPTVPQAAPPPQPSMQPSVQQAVPPQAMMQQPPVRQPGRPESVWPGSRQPMVQQPLRTPYPETVMRQQTRAIPQRPPLSSRRETTSVRQPTLTPMPSGQAVTTQEPVSTTRELWISAREEFQRGNIDVSIRNYKEVIATSSNNYDAYGELGNVYLSRGSEKEAASAYFEAAAILVKIGQVDRARSLLPTLGRLDRAKAEELNQLIRGTTG